MSLLQTVINYNGGPGSSGLSKAPRLGERLTLFWSAVSLPPPAFSPQLSTPEGWLVRGSSWEKGHSWGKKGTKRDLLGVGVEGLEQAWARASLWQ